MSQYQEGVVQLSGKYEYPIVFECNKVYCIDWLYFVGNMKELLNYFELMD